MSPGAAPRVDVLGVEVSALDMPGAVGTIGRWIEDGDREYVCVTGVHGVMESHDDPALREIHNRAGMVTPDGMPLVWLAHHAGFPAVRRVYGPDLMLAVCAESVARGWRHYLYGGAEGVAEALAARLRTRFPGLLVTGCATPPFRPLSPAEDDAAVARINGAAPDVVWVGLGTPKQERWMAAHRGRLGAAVLIGVGAAFDLHTGRTRQAPPWVQRNGLEWLFRLGTEPRRLWRRYLGNNPRFVWGVLRQELRRGARSPAGSFPPAR